MTEKQAGTGATPAKQASSVGKSANSLKQPRTATAGSFKPGQSGNPNGRPSIPVEVRDAARAHTAACIERLAHWVNSDNPTASVTAAQALLNRGWGMPNQTVTGEDGGPIQVEAIRRLIVDPKAIDG